MIFPNRPGGLLSGKERILSIDYVSASYLLIIFLEKYYENKFI